MRLTTFLKLDFNIQRIIGSACILFTFIIYGLLLLLPFGIWQVISSLIMVFIYKDKKRIPHLIFTLLWSIIFLFLIEYNLDESSSFILYLIVLPSFVGIWYYRQTKTDYYNCINRETTFVDKF